jgi:hypothetical protein
VRWCVVHCNAIALVPQALPACLADNSAAGKGCSDCLIPGVHFHCKGFCKIAQARAAHHTPSAHQHAATYSPDELFTKS